MEHQQEITAAPPQRRMLLLAGLSVFALCAYHSMEFAKVNILAYTYTDALDQQVAVGQCIVSRLSQQHKIQLAETVARPPSEALFVKVLPASLEGAVTEEKRAALRALRDRESLRSKAVEQVNAKAAQCGYWKGGGTGGSDQLRAVADVNPFQFTLKWLAYDATYKQLIKAARQRPPDAAQLMYERLVPPRG